MIESKLKGMIFIICIFLISSLFSGCAPSSSVVRTVELNRDRYICKLDPSKFSQYKGKRILLSSIEDESKNTTNFNYYNPQQTIGYELYYSSSSMQQPVVSYYWYALQKAFECAGVKIIEEDSSIYDAELLLTFNSLTDEEIQFMLDLTKKGKLAYTKDYTVRMPKVEASKNDILEQRAYGMLDAIVTKILNDPNFQQAFLKNQPPSVYGDQKYESIKGIVLKNGDVIKGEILNMNVNTVQIRTKHGKVLTYSFMDEVETLIRE